MTNEEQRIAIAGACGWEEIRPHHAYMNLIGRHPEFGPNKDVPDFPNDLNGMHKAEKALTELQVCTYDTELNKIVMRDWSTKSPVLTSMDWHASSSQRAEAFLRTLNLWKN